jgi:hypothetical protein
VTPKFSDKASKTRQIAVHWHFLHLQCILPWILQGQGEAVVTSHLLATTATATVQLVRPKQSPN